MRALFAFAGGSGHAEPLVPIAAALRAAGHAVAFAGRSDIAGGLRVRGFVAFDEPVDTTGPLAEPAPLLVPDREREERVVREAYAGRIAGARAASVTDVCGSWRPDVVVCDELDFGAMLAAERLGLPHVTVLVTAAGSFVRPVLVAEPLEALRAQLGLPPDPHFELPQRHLVLSPCPPSLRDPSFPLPANGHALRPASLASATTGAQDPPRWLSELGERPVVYATLGTIFNMESGDLLQRVVEGLRALPVDLVVSVGPGRAPVDLAPQPPHVRVERHVSHAHLLPRCALVVSHGGSGTLVAALAAGLPSLLLPLGADHLLNAARCAALGVGVALDAVHATPRTVAAAAAALLDDQCAHVAARRIQAEISALPDADAAVPLVESLVAGLSRSSFSPRCR
jgi:UDP:flavonoid glycosyltransferase YjiC (YdhE family)